MDRSTHGFAGMDRARVREIARMGGQAVHRMGKGHVFDGVTGKTAGRKGGRASAERRKEDLTGCRLVPEESNRANALQGK